METIICNLGEEFKNYLREFAEGESISIDDAEITLTKKLYRMVCTFLGKLYEEKDQEILEDKQKRKEEGLTVKRLRDERNILSIFGPIEYQRTYYQKASGGYEYPIDAIAGVRSYDRLSTGVSAALVDSACHESYARASLDVVESNVSKQTVMNKIRKAWAPEAVHFEDKKKVPVLHIDADEDHVALQNGRRTIVKTATVYEGTETVSKGKNRCIGAFNISSHGVTADRFWQDVYSAMDAVYDLDDVKVYIHGDGADWIAKGRDWMPMDTVFVLDAYHVNKNIIEATANIPEPDRAKYIRATKESFKDENADFLKEMTRSMKESYPDCRETITKGMGYLINHFEAIHIKHIDANARCGSSEPHVQHVLSHRLSSIPMGWSEKTLEHLAPILAAGCFTFDRPEEPADGLKPALTSASAVEDIRVKKISYSSGLPDADNAIFLPTSNYKKTALGQILRRISKI